MGDTKCAYVCVCVWWGYMRMARGSPALLGNFNAATSLGFILLQCLRKREKKNHFPSLCLLPAQLVIDPDSLHM